jgi:hypothetical protein
VEFGRHFGWVSSQVDRLCALQSNPVTASPQLGALLEYLMYDVYDMRREAAASSGQAVDAREEASHDELTLQLTPLGASIVGTIRFDHQVPSDPRCPGCLDKSLGYAIPELREYHTMLDYCVYNRKKHYVSARCAGGGRQGQGGRRGPQRTTRAEQTEDARPSAGRLQGERAPYECGPKAWKHPSRVSPIS